MNASQSVVRKALGDVRNKQMLGVEPSRQEVKKPIQLRGKEQPHCKPASLAKSFNTLKNAQGKQSGGKVGVSIQVLFERLKLTN